MILFFKLSLYCKKCFVLLKLMILSTIFKNFKKFFLRLNFIVFFILITQNLNAQELTSNDIISQLDCAEKIYLQLNRSVFTTNETIWLKAIVTDAITHNPTRLSEALHVELIDFDERIIDKKLLKLKFGISDTFFQLDEALSPGKYLIRAYTEWNKNFGKDFITEQYIDVFAPKVPTEDTKIVKNVTLSETETQQFQLSAEIMPQLINPKHKRTLKVYLDMGVKEDSVEVKKDKKGIYRLNYLLPKDVVKTKLKLEIDPLKLKNNEISFVSTYSQSIIINKDYLDLQFFPESGKLVNGLLTSVAFKALDYNNKGKQVHGVIVDELGKSIMPFKSNDLGMGVFGFRPDIKKQYFGEVKDEKGTIYKYPLPKIWNKGSLLTIKKLKDLIAIRVIANDLHNESFTLTTSCRGVKYHEFDLNLNKGKRDVAIEKIALPEGIIIFSVLNKNKQPILQRLFFNYKEEDRIHLKAETNLSNYSQRDKTIINLKTIDKYSNSVKTNLSVLILDKDILNDMKYNRNTICSYFLMSSELRGKVENPFQYFDKTNSNRYRDMDALMLTQGWSNYIYQPIKLSRVFKYKAEKGLVLSGSVGEYFNTKKKPKNLLELTMMTFDEPKMVFSKKVDSTGHFSFNLGDVYTNDLEFLIQCKNSKGKQKNYTINIDEKKSPKVAFKKEEQYQLVDSINAYVKRSIERKQVEDDFKIASNTIALDEVNISGYKMTPEREEMMELHGLPDVVIEDKQLHKKIKKWSYGLFSVLRASYPDDIEIRRVGSNGGFLIAEAFGADFTFILIDGIPVLLRDYRYIGDLPTKEIRSVEILNSPKNARKYINLLWPNPMSQPTFLTISIINIYTYSKNGLFGVQRTTGITKAKLAGFSPIREFYVPKHEDLTTEDWKVPDLRSTIYWNPNVETDSEGNAKVEFYNPDNIGDMLVIVEGITNNGQLGYFETSYKVEEKLEK